MPAGTSPASAPAVGRENRAKAARSDTAAKSIRRETAPPGLELVNRHFMNRSEFVASKPPRQPAVNPVVRHVLKAVVVNDQRHIDRRLQAEMESPGKTDLRSHIPS